jgi:hypothetical protein
VFACTENKCIEHESVRTGSKQQKKFEAERLSAAYKTIAEYNGGFFEHHLLFAGA